MPSLGIRQSAIVESSPIEQIAVLYLAKKKEISLGPFIVAQILDAFFLGLFLMQIGTYLTSTRKKDSWLQRALVYGVLAVNIATSVLAVYWIFHLFVVQYGTFAQFLDIKTLFWFYITNGIGTALVQFFFVNRVYELTRRHPGRAAPFIACLCLLIAGCFACAIVIKVRGDSLGPLASAGDKTLHMTGTIWSACTMACDISITVTILAILIRKRTGWENTDKIITRLIWYTMQSQLPPTIFAIVYLIEYNVIAPKTPYVSVPFIMLQGKLYAFSLLHTLNARDNMAPHTPERLPAVWSDPRERKSFNVIDTFKKNRFSPEAQSPVYPYFTSVQVTTDTYIHNDRDAVPFDTLDFRQTPLYGRPRGINRMSTGDQASMTVNLHNSHPTGFSAGSAQSTELDLVDMHVERLALEIASNEDARSSTEITLPQTSESNHVVGKA